MRTKLRQAVLVSLVVSIACSSGDSSKNIARDDTVSTNQQETADVDALRALGYLGYSQERANEGGHGVVLHDDSRVFPGFNFYVTRVLCRADLVDMQGNRIRSWSAEPCGYWSNAELLPNGDLLVAGAEISEEGERRQLQESSYVLRLTWEGDIVWKKRMYAHHDVELTPQGGLLTLTAGWRRIPSISKKVDVQDNWLTLLTPEGTVHEQLSLYDLLTSRLDLFRLQKTRISTSRGLPEIDLFHANSVEWIGDSHLIGRHPLYSEDHVLVSVRHQDAVALINWANEELVWAWGQGEISGPHDATLLANGNILLFDNGLVRRWSRVIEVDPRQNSIVWEYRAAKPKDFFTASRGANQRLANGNTLITNSDSGQVFEVTPDGEIVWEYINTHLDPEGHPATIVRMKRYDTGFVDMFLD